MTDTPDAQLLEQFAQNQSEAAFTELVKRYIGLVYSVAYRKTGNPQQSEDVTQAVFIILARKAGSLGGKTVLPGWLYHTARLTAANAHRAESARIHREQEAFMQSHLEEPATEALWRELSPQLEEAMAGLGAGERDALVLRYFQDKSVAEVGTLLGVQENTAQKRVSRALEKLRKFFAKRGVVSTTAIIAGVISANSVQSAPAGLAQTIAAVAVAKGAAASTSTLTLVKGALKLMAWTKAQTPIVVGVVLIVTAGTITATLKRVINPDAWADDPNYWRLNNPPLASYPPVLILRPTRFPGHGGGLGDGSHYLEKDATVQELIGIAYGIEDTRIIFPEGPSEDRPRPGYDLMLTLSNHPTVALQEAIQKQFGLVGHAETIVTNALLLRVARRNAPGLQPASQRPRPAGLFSGDQIVQGKIVHSIVYRETFLDSLRFSIEDEIREPVLDETGLKGQYDVDLRWQAAAPQTDLDVFQRALLEQLGLELVPSVQPIQMLVVEKVQ